MFIGRNIGTQILMKPCHTPEVNLSCRKNNLALHTLYRTIYEKLNA